MGIAVTATMDPLDRDLCIWVDQVDRAGGFLTLVLHDGEAKWEHVDPYEATDKKHCVYRVPREVIPEFIKAICRLDMPGVTPSPQSEVTKAMQGHIDDLRAVLFKLAKVEDK